MAATNSSYNPSQPGINPNDPRAKAYSIEVPFDLAGKPSRIEDLESVRLYINCLDFATIKKDLYIADGYRSRWSRAKTDYAEHQYKNWLFLRRKYEEEDLVPSVDIGVFWRAHILDTRVYFRDTARIFGYYLHYAPSLDWRRENDYYRDASKAWEKTQQLYLAEFKERMYEYRSDHTVRYPQQSSCEVSRRTVPTASPPQRCLDDSDPAQEIPFFIHINRTGGNTVRYILNENYDRSKFLNARLASRAVSTGAGQCAVTVNSPNEDVTYLTAEIRARQRKLDCIAANLPFGIHRFLERRVAYFTFLREPVDRCMSEWHMRYSGAHDGGEVWAIFRQYDFDIKRMLGEGVAYHLSNEQVRMISGTSALEIGKDEFDLARELIKERYLLVGVTEKMDLCLRLIGRHFGWRNLTYKRQNIGLRTSASTFPPDSEKVFREINEWDIRLYEWVVNDYLPRRAEQLSAKLR
jgi:hypothetical protein